MNSALITGGTGFVGRHLARRLTAMGTRVSLIVRDERRSVAVDPGPTTYGHDGSFARMRQIVEAAEPDVVYHLASVNIAVHQPEDLDRLIDSNIRFGSQLLEAMHACGVQRFINTGTYWQFGASGDYDPMCLYAATKQAFEAIVGYYARATGLRCLTLVLFDTYGPGDARNKLLTSLIRQQEGDPPLALSPGWQRLAITYIDDVIDAYVEGTRHLNGLPAGAVEAYDVRSEDTVSVRELVDAVSAARGEQVRVKWNARPYRDRERMEPYGTGTPLPKWRARTTLADGLQQILARASW
jgi:nucleoside-diphosphate-sugar epimerase